MDSLIRFGFTIEEIQIMMDSNEDISQVKSREIDGLIAILKNVGCSSEHIKNILLCNPFCLTNDLNCTKDLINTFFKLGFCALYVLFDSDPYLLNMNCLELEKLYSQKLEEGLEKEEIFDFIQYNTFFRGDGNECCN